MTVHPLTCDTDTVTYKKDVWSGFDKKSINQGFQLATVGVTAVGMTVIVPLPKTVIGLSKKDS